MVTESFGMAGEVAIAALLAIAEGAWMMIMVLASSNYFIVALQSTFASASFTSWKFEHENGIFARDRDVPSITT